MFGITHRETQVIALIVTGMSSKEAARQLGIAPRTVERHLDHVRLKTRTRNRSHLVAFALREGLINPATNAQIGAMRDDDSPADSDSGAPRPDSN